MGGKYICQYRSDEGRFVGGEVDEKKGVVFTGKDASDLYANKMDVKDQRPLNMGFVICM